MIFQNVNELQLTKLLANHMDRPTWPGIKSQDVIERARAYARESGLWDRIEAAVAPGPIPVLRYSDYQDFHRTGRRVGYEALMNQRTQRTHWNAMALWLNHPAADFQQLQDLLWAWCESEWMIPAHDRQNIELFSSTVGQMLAEYYWLFEDRLEPRVHERIVREIHQRLLDITFDWRKPDWWRTYENNWNTVCNANLIQIGFYLIRDPVHLAGFIHPLYRRMDYALAYYTQDGGCVEGAGYWEFGFGHFIDAALALYERTGGKINLADDDHIRRISRFPLAVQLRGNLRATYSDASNGYVSAATAMKINRLIPAPELFEHIEPTKADLPKLEDIRGLALYEGQRRLPASKPVDCILPDAGLVKLYSGNEVILFALAGNNGVSHNHNDIGSFMVVVGKTALLTDPGAPIYSQKVFSPQRYEMLLNRSRGHSIPIINGHEQPNAAAYHGTIAATGLNTKGEKTVEIDMSKAYDDPTLTSLVRTFDVSPGGDIKLKDVYQFKENPSALEEGFITFESVSISDDGQTATIEDGEHSVTLRAESKGRFTVEEFSAAQHEGRDARTLRRIIFKPAVLEREMQLSFAICPGAGSK